MKGTELIKVCVRRNNEEYKENSDYRKYVKAMSEINLGSITENEVEKIIKRFLIDWGKMQRVLSEKKRPGWTKRLANLIQANSRRLNNLKILNLSDSDLELGNYEKEIENCYEAFKEVVKPVAAAKVLHLICPQFFPPWDNAIHDATLSEDIEMGGKHVIELPQAYYNLHKQQIEAFVSKSKKKRKPVKFSATDYYTFMQFVQSFIQGYKATLSPLAIYYKKSVVKIADDCFWFATHRPLSFIL